MIKRGVLLSLYRNKKAADIILLRIIFLVLNIMFIGSLFFFGFQASTGALVYEQAYAKQIALILDRAKPISQISIDFEDGFELAEKNELDIQSLVKIEDNFVIIKLAKGGGYSFRYFSDYDINSYFDEESLIITINEKPVQSGN